VRILPRADSGFAREALMSWCERNRVDFVFDLARNAWIVDEIDVELAYAEEEARTRLSRRGGSRNSSTPPSIPGCGADA
jgi:hypothetical protein